MVRLVRTGGILKFQVGVSCLRMMCLITLVIVLACESRPFGARCCRGKVTVEGKWRSGKERKKLS